MHDKVAVITGADSGIGQGTAIEFAREGADITILYHTDAAGAADTKREVEVLGRRAIVIQGDVRSEADVERLFDESTEMFGRVDILVNNAGVDASGVNVEDIDIDAFDASLRTNLYGPVMMCKHFIRRFKSGPATHGGRILNIASGHEEIPRAGAADYVCAKGALRNLTRTLALELAESGITVNNIAPGMVLTPFNQDAIDDPDVREQQNKSIPMKRAAGPREIGRLAVFLASADARLCHRRLVRHGRWPDAERGPGCMTLGAMAAGSQRRRERSRPLFAAASTPAASWQRQCLSRPSTARPHCIHCTGPRPGQSRGRIHGRSSNFGPYARQTTGE